MIGIVCGLVERPSANLLAIRYKPSASSQPLLADFADGFFVGLGRLLYIKAGTGGVWRRLSRLLTRSGTALRDFAPRMGLAKLLKQQVAARMTGIVCGSVVWLGGALSDDML
ncbi:hypothetical protein [Neisseria animalis]|uniref:hypothetical protein n=1 Tax=Neisseria animalis TaxID=492 RepID=UPI000F4ED52E|nr:hypothetical protein [Neisseria animalis]